MTLLLVLTVLLSWGIAGVFDKKALAVGKPGTVFAVSQLFHLPLLAGMFVVLNVAYGQWNLRAGLFFWEGLNAISALLATLAYFYALSKAQASYIVGITAGYPVLGKLLAIPVLGEEFSWIGLAGAALVSLGVALIGLSRSTSESTESRSSERWKVLGAIVLCTVLWAVLGIFEKRSLGYGRPLEAYTALTCWKSFLAIGVLFFLRNSLKGAFGVVKFSWASAFLLTVGNLAFILALSGSEAGYMIVMTAAYPLVMYGAAMLWLGERLIGVRAAGIVIILAGCVVCEMFH